MLAPGHEKVSGSSEAANATATAHLDRAACRHSEDFLVCSLTAMAYCLRRLPDQGSLSLLLADIAPLPADHSCTRDAAPEQEAGLEQAH